MQVEAQKYVFHAQTSDTACLDFRKASSEALKSEANMINPHRAGIRIFSSSQLRRIIFSKKTDKRQK